jgi:hypothetical protein
MLGYFHLGGRRDIYLIVKNFLPDHALTIVEEGRFLKNHLVKNTPEGPYICLLTA